MIIWRKSISPKPFWLVFVYLSVVHNSLAKLPALIRFYLSKLLEKIRVAL